MGAVIRSRKDGDKFYPKGLSGGQKLKDYFINNKIDQDKRDLIPLVVNDKDEIIWVGGYRLDRRFEVDKRCKNILAMQII